MVTFNTGNTPCFGFPGMDEYVVKQVFGQCTFMHIGLLNEIRQNRPISYYGLAACQSPENDI